MVHQLVPGGDRICEVMFDKLEKRFRGLKRDMSGEAVYTYPSYKELINIY